MKGNVNSQGKSKGSIMIVFSISLWVIVSLIGIHALIFQREPPCHLYTSFLEINYPNCFRNCFPLVRKAVELL